MQLVTRFCDVAATGSGNVINNSVKQPLLQAVLPDGTKLLLATLADGRCAILRNDAVIHTSGSDADGVDDAVNLFMRYSASQSPNLNPDAV